MTTYLGKSCSFGLPRVPFVNCRQFMYLVISLLVLRAGCGIWLYQFLIIAYLFTLDKTLERLVFKHLYNHFRENNIITSFQSGFTLGDSTVNQLMYLYNIFCQALDFGKQVRVVFCDIKKSFDRVWHAGLIHKLKAAGVSGSLLKWFISYLADRKQRVVLPGAQSN